MARYNKIFNSLKKLGGKLLVVLLLGIIAIFLSLQNEEESQNRQTKENNSYNISGIARASDGDSLEISNRRIRLLGIDAPELYQNCKDKNGNSWKCGRASHKKLSSLVRGRQVTCVGLKKDRYDRLLAKCTIMGDDIGAILISEGLAVSYRGSGDYLAEQNRARKNKIGMWAGKFENPQDWRRRNPRQ